MPNSRHSGAIFSPSSRRAIHFSRSSMGLHAFQGILRSPQKARLCNPCLRYELSPLSREGHSLLLAAQVAAVEVAGCEQISALIEQRAGPLRAVLLVALPQH